MSAQKSNGHIDQIKITSEQGGKTKLKLPFNTWYAADKKGAAIKNLPEGFIELSFTKGGELVLKNRHP